MRYPLAVRPCRRGRATASRGGRHQTWAAGIHRSAPEAASNAVGVLRERRAHASRRSRLRGLRTAAAGSPRRPSAVPSRAGRIASALCLPAPSGPSARPTGSLRPAMQAQAGRCAVKPGGERRARTSHLVAADPERRPRAVPGSSLAAGGQNPPLRARAAATSVCVLVSVYLRGARENGVWVALRSPQTQSRISEASGLWRTERGDAPRAAACAEPSSKRRERPRGHRAVAPSPRFRSTRLRGRQP